jgi:serine/threonine-protein kinase
VVHVLGQVCASLAEAHAIGLVHRDIKPANIMLCRRGELTDFVKVLDFGLAKDLSEDGRTDLSRSAVLIGTPLYLAPEVALQHAVDARADIYALGAVGYFMLTGTPVFEGKTVLELCFKHLSTPPDSPSERLGRRLPPELEAIVLRCLAKDPAERPLSVEELAASLRSLDLGSWTPEIMKRWWAERGESIEQRVRAARRRDPPEPSDHTLEVQRSDGAARDERAGASA